MNQQKIRLIFITMFLLTLPPQFSQSRNMNKVPLIPLEDFFRNPEKASFQISPDGEYISYTAPYKGRMNLFVQAANADSAIRITSESDRDISSYFWANSKRILYLKDTGGDENFKLYGVNIDGSNLIGLTNFDMTALIQTVFPSIGSAVRMLIDSTLFVVE